MPCASSMACTSDCCLSTLAVSSSRSSRSATLAAALRCGVGKGPGQIPVRESCCAVMVQSEVNPETSINPCNAFVVVFLCYRTHHFQVARFTLDTFRHGTQPVLARVPRRVPAQACETRHLRLRPQILRQDHVASCNAPMKMRRASPRLPLALVALTVGWPLSSGSPQSLAETTVGAPSWTRAHRTLGGLNL